jgi:hypothetical protein
MVVDKKPTETSGKQASEQVKPSDAKAGDSKEAGAKKNEKPLIDFEDLVSLF